MKKSMLAISACLALGFTACSDRETSAPPAGDLANGRAEAPPAETIPPSRNESAPVADSNVGMSETRSGMGATSSTERSTIHRSRSVVRSNRAKISDRNDDGRVASRGASDVYTEAGEPTSDTGGVNTGATSASSEAGYSTQSGQPMAGRHNPAAINSGH